MEEEAAKKERNEEVESDGGDGGVEMVRVLVVDDSPVDRKIVEMLLKKSGRMFEVIAVDSGEKAMEVLGLSGVTIGRPHFNEQKIDVILTDYCMPHMTGYDLLKAIKEHDSLKSIPVVMMSSENDPQRISRCGGIGAEDFILKPLKVKDVQRLRTYAVPRTPISKSGTKRKLPVDLVAENSGYETCQWVAKVAVA
ncbi:two-component response regulator ORR1-like [Musa acuminata AAA Group]|uniref:two-component response regulator ORR1-like n=1 Tax=Musa acuminata AAA Group TaxID=214697 RepID=UPI0031DEC1EB